MDTTEQIILPTVGRFDRKVGSIGILPMPIQISCSPDGKYIACVNEDKSYYLWSKEGKQLSTFGYDRKEVTSLSFSQGRYITCGRLSDDYGGYDLDFWKITPYFEHKHSTTQVNGAENVKSLKKICEGYDIAYSHSGKLIAYSKKNEVVICEDDTYLTTLKFKNTFKILWSPDDSYILVSDLISIEIWETNKWEKVKTFSLCFPKGISWSPDSQHLAIATAEINVWETTNWSKVRSFGYIYEAPSRKIEWVGNHYLAILCPNNGSLEVVNAFDEKQPRYQPPTFYNIGHKSMCWSPENKLYCVMYDNVIVYDTQAIPV